MNHGAIKFKIVQTLPVTDIETDAIYLVPITPDEGDNNYAEYIYVNGAWEELGKIAVHVDLRDYVKNTDYATSSVGGVIKTGNNFAVGSSSGAAQCNVRNYEQYTSDSNNTFISKGTLENVIVGKELVSNTDYATASVGGVIKSGWYNLSMDNSGHPYASTRTYAQYQADGNSTFIGKGTLDNVLNAIVGDISSALDAINGENI